MRSGINTGPRQEAAESLHSKEPERSGSNLEKAKMQNLPRVPFAKSLPGRVRRSDRRAAIARKRAFILSI